MKGLNDKILRLSAIRFVGSSVRRLVSHRRFPEINSGKNDETFEKKKGTRITEEGGKKMKKKEKKPGPKNQMEKEIRSLRREYDKEEGNAKEEKENEKKNKEKEKKKRRERK